MIDRRLLFALLLCVPMLNGSVVIYIEAASGAMKSVWLSSMNQLLNGVATEYAAVMAVERRDWDTAVEDGEGIVALDGTLTGIRVDLGSDAGTGADQYEFTVMLDTGSGTNTTAVTCKVIGALDFCTTTGLTVAVSAGDRLAMRVVGTEENTLLTPSADWSIAYETTTANSSILMGVTELSLSTSLVRYTGFNGPLIIQDAALKTEFLAPVNGTLKNLYVRTLTTVTTGGDYTFVVLEDGSPTALTCKIESGVGDAQSCEDLTHPIDVAVGKRYVLKITPTDTPSGERIAVGIEFNADDADTFLIMGRVSENSHATFTEYSSPSLGDNSWTTSASDKLTRTFALTATDFAYFMDVDPGATSAEKYDVSIVKDDLSPTTLTCEINGDSSPIECIVNGKSVAFNGTDKMAIQINPDSSPTVSFRHSWTIAAIVP